MRTCERPRTPLSRPAGGLHHRQRQRGKRPCLARGARRRGRRGPRRRAPAARGGGGWSLPRAHLLLHRHQVKGGGQESWPQVEATNCGLRAAGSSLQRELPLTVHLSIHAPPTSLLQPLQMEGPGRQRAPRLCARAALPGRECKSSRANQGEQPALGHSCLAPAVPTDTCLHACPPGPPQVYRGRNLDGAAAARAAIAEAEAAGGRLAAFYCESIVSCGGQARVLAGCCAAVLRAVQFLYMCF